MKTPRALLAASLLLAAAAAIPAWGQTVSFNGSLGAQAALLLIDGEPVTVRVGQSIRGVTLVSLSAGGAVLEVQGRRQTLQLGASPGRVGDGAAAPNTGRQIVISSGPGGHFTASGSINGQATEFLVDTGATSVSISQAEAERMNLKYREGRRAMAQTANGTIPVYMLTLVSVRVGDVEVRNVDAIVIPAQMSHVLLGNSFLTRFQMNRNNDILTLQLRY